MEDVSEYNDIMVVVKTRLGFAEEVNSVSHRVRGPEETQSASLG